MSPRDDFLQKRYDQLWAQSIQRIRNGSVEIDPVLAAGKGDRRRGSTLLFRPPEPTQSRVREFLEELREIEPEQVYYDPTEMHVTFLSMFTATEEHEALFSRNEEFAEALTAWASAMEPFSISFRGVTASPGAVMIQGFTDSNKLNDMRDVLRRDLHAGGLSQGLDQRYRLEVAHMTVVRFRHPLRNGVVFAKALERMRDRDFGSCTVDSLALAKSDWYMSRETIEDLGHFKLGGG